jgi:hypothetical protein
VAGGGGLVASGASSLCDHAGDARPNLALADVLGVELPDDHVLRDPARRRQAAAESIQTYLRLTPELRAGVYGPHPAGEPPAAGTRHPILSGFDATDILPFGGTLHPLRVAPHAQVLATFVPARPAFPPEAVWSRTTSTDLPGLVVSERPGAGRVVYLAADLDRRAARDNNPDFARVLENAVRWTARDDIPLEVQGPGYLDCHLYRQPGRLILHCVNLTNAGTWREPVTEIIPVGPVRVRVRLSGKVRGQRVRSTVSERQASVRVQNGWAAFETPSIADHEMWVID